MEEGKNGWKIVDREAGVLCREYKFGGGVATTFVFRGKGDGLVVVSPANHLEAAELDAVKDFGEVKALVANNGFHWLGQQAWRKHFPDAKGFAPSGAIARLTKKTTFAYEPLDSAAPLLGDSASLMEPTGLAGNAFAFVRAKSATYWYTSDLLANHPVLPTNFIFKTLMSMTDSGPGYKVFRPAVWLQVKDKKGLTSWFDKALAEAPPTMMIPGHGQPVQMPELVDATRALIAQL
jgi:hypothetical protein